MHKRIAALSGHTIILGYGRMGASVAQHLHKARFPFVVIERRKELVALLTESPFLWLEGDAASDDNLKLAGVGRAEFLVSTVDDDADGLFATIATKSLNPSIHVIVRANIESSRKKMLIAGADRVILPFADSGQAVAQSIMDPEVKATVDLTSLGADECLEFINVAIDETSPLLGKSLSTCGFRRDGFMVIGIRRLDKSFTFAPSADEVFSNGDSLVAVCTRESYKSTIRLTTGKAGH